MKILDTRTPDDISDGEWFGDPAFSGNPWAIPLPSDASVPPPETSVFCDKSDDVEKVFQTMRRASESPEWELSMETLIAMQPYIKAERIERFKNCRSNAYFYRNKESGRVKVLSNACKDRACPFCAQVRSREVADQISAWLAGMKHPRFLTLTLRSSNAPLPVQIDNIYKAFRRFRLMKGMNKFLRSGVWFFQVTLNEKTQQWHPHLHCVLVGKWAEWEFLRDQWKIASKGSFVLDIEPITDPAKCAHYVARYSARPYRMEGLSLEKRKECIAAFASRRLFGTWGPKPERPVVKKEKVDLGQWEPIGSFAYVHYCNHVDLNARLILDAWKKGTPLPEGVSCHAFNYSEYSGWYERSFEAESTDFKGEPPREEKGDGNTSRSRKRKGRPISLVAEPCLF